MDRYRASFGVRLAGRLTLLGLVLVIIPEPTTYGPGLLLVLLGVVAWVVGGL